MKEKIGVSIAVEELWEMVNQGIENQLAIGTLPKDFVVLTKPRTATISAMGVASGAHERSNSINRGTVMYPRNPHCTTMRQCISTTVCSGPTMAGDSVDLLT
jgi:hypothetical protein